MEYIAYPKKKMIKQLPAQEFGRIEVITGPMFSGKSTELMRRLERYHLAGKSIVYYVPDIDTRTREELSIASPRQVFSERVRTLPTSLTSCLFEYVDVVAFDEAQFFDERIITVIDSQRRMGTIVLVAGLDMDFMQRPFGYMGQIMAIANKVDKLTAICKCGHEAPFTARTSGEDDLIKIGDCGYIPVCGDCYFR